MGDQQPRLYDRRGKRLRIGQRCRRYNAAGDRVRQKVVITALHADGQVEFRRMDNLSTGVTLAERIERLAKPKETSPSMLRYQLDQLVVEEASKKLKKAKRVRSH